MSKSMTHLELNPLAFKINMLSTNIMRIHSQNSKLQDLLQHRQQLNKLKEIAYSSANTWKRLVTLSEAVQQHYEQVIAKRETINQTLNQHSEHLNRTILADIKKAKIGLTDLQQKLNHHSIREVQSIKTQIKKEKKKVLDKIERIKGECLGILQKAEEEEKAAMAVQIEEEVKSIEGQCESKHRRCRIALGQLKNLIQYYHWKRYQQTTVEVSLSQIANSNFKAINRQLNELELAQRKVKSEVQWLRGKTRTAKKHKTNTISYSPQQMTTLTQMRFGIEECQQQLVGLDKICGEKATKQGKAFNEKQISQLVTIKQRLIRLKASIQNYSSFYSIFF